MPARNIIKVYSENSFYHIYNRGVEKRIIFKDEQDYGVFLGYLKEYLSPPEDFSKYKKIVTFKGETFKGVPRVPNNYSKEIELLVYCLMPNHFHFIVKQYPDRSIQNFVRSLCTRYSMYFNKRYTRVGSLFQGPYKAVLVNNEEYLLHLSRYIHQNPEELNINLAKAHSSYPEYIGERKTEWVKTDLILSFFNKATESFVRGFNTYKNFVEGSEINSSEILGKMILEPPL